MNFINMARNKAVQGVPVRPRISATIRYPMANTILPIVILGIIMAIIILQAVINSKVSYPEYLGYWVSLPSVLPCLTAILATYLGRRYIFVGSFICQLVVINFSVFGGAVAYLHVITNDHPLYKLFCVFSAVLTVLQIVHLAYIYLEARTNPFRFSRLRNETTPSISSNTESVVTEMT